MKIILTDLDRPKIEAERDRYLAECKAWRSRGYKHRFQAFSDVDQDAQMFDVYAAEYCVAKFCEVDWPNTTGTNDGPDVGDWIQVKRIRPKFNHNLMITYKKDTKRASETYAYVLVEGQWPSYEIVGWIGGDRAKEIGSPFASTNRDDKTMIVYRDDLRTDFDILKCIGQSEWIS